MIATNLVSDHWRKTGRERRAISDHDGRGAAGPVLHPAQDVDVRDADRGRCRRGCAARSCCTTTAGFGVREVAAHARAGRRAPSRPTCITRAPGSRQRSVSRHDPVVRGDAVTDRRDPIEAWLSSDVELLPPPPGAFERVHRRARHRRAMKATSAAAGAAVDRRRRRRYTAGSWRAPDQQCSHGQDQNHAGRSRPSHAQLALRRSRDPGFLRLAAARSSSRFPAHFRDFHRRYARRGARRGRILRDGSLHRHGRNPRLRQQLDRDRRAGRTTRKRQGRRQPGQVPQPSSTAGRTGPRSTQPTTAERPGAP